MRCLIVGLALTLAGCSSVIDAVEQEPLPDNYEGKAEHHNHCKRISSAWPIADRRPNRGTSCFSDSLGYLPSRYLRSSVYGRAGDGIKIGVNISNQWPMPFRVRSRQRWPRNKRGWFWRSAHASQRIYDNPAHAGWTDILPVDIALQRQPNLTWPGIIWPPQPISKP
jgi:hypothetical protein